MPSQATFPLSDFSWSTAGTSSCTRGGQSGQGSLPDQVSFTFSQCPHQMENQLAARCGGINILCQAEKIHTALLKKVACLDEIFGGATDTESRSQRRYAPALEKLIRKCQKTVILRLIDLSLPQLQRE